MVQGIMRVIDENKIFVEDEKRLGMYTVQILRRTNRGWSPDILQMQALVTNFRLLIKPFHRKYTPASIPSSYIKKVDNREIERHRTVCLTLETGHELYIILNPRHVDNLTEDLRAMIAPPLPFQFDDSIAKEHIAKMISFFGGISPFHP